MKHLSIFLLCCLAGCSTRPAALARRAPDVVPNTWYWRVAPAPYDESDDQRTAEREAIGRDRDKAFAFLLSTGRFAEPHVGDANPEVSTQVIAFQTILRQPDAAGAFDAMLHRASVPGQLYALCGLYLIDRAAFDKAAPAYFADQRSVGVASGCVTYPTPVHVVVRNLDVATVRLSPGQALSDWWNEHGGGSYLDIIGGAYPYEFAEAKPLNAAR
jgi:hypothetical protein